jgi:hypothetical protein
MPKEPAPRPKDLKIMMGGGGKPAPKVQSPKGAPAAPAKTAR